MASLNLTSTQSPLLQITKGNPTHDQLAALSAIVSSLAARRSAPPQRVLRKPAVWSLILDANTCRSSSPTSASIKIYEILAVSFPGLVPVL